MAVRRIWPIIAGCIDFKKCIWIELDEFVKNKDVSGEIEMTNRGHKYINRNSPKVYIRTYGCQMNEYDSEVMAGMLKDRGYYLTENLEKADVILLNTCYVREKVKHKIMSKLGELKKLKEKKSNLILGLCGCLGQKEPERILHQAPYLDFILGSSNFFELPQVLKEISPDHASDTEPGEGHVGRIRTRETQGQIVKVEENRIIPENLPKLRKRKFTAFVPVMRGCDNFCSFCNVPYVRGRERSRLAYDILKEVKELASQGYKEVTLLGQNVNSYGKGLRERIDFADLLGLVNKIEGIRRIRFTTSHPKDLSDKLIKMMRDLDKVCEHLHLPLQSGSNKVLSRMNRKYTRDEYINLVDKLRRAIPEITLTTDIIVGFPGEEEEDFQDTLDLVERVHFDGAFTFCYSPLQGTKAAEYRERVPDKIGGGRLRRLIEVQQRIILERNKFLVGKKFEILVEGLSKKSPYELEGRTRGNKIVIFKGKEDLIGRFILVRVLKAGCWALKGEMVSC